MAQVNSFPGTQQLTGQITWLFFLIAMTTDSVWNEVARVISITFHELVQTVSFFLPYQQYV